MDTSEQYIKMCDCPEIQANHKLKRYEVTGDPYDVTGQTYNSDRRWTGGIWLPRQDQLQEMLDKQAYDLVRPFYLWCFDNCLDICNYSMEQLWLAFVMKEKYSKVWSGTEWIST